MRKVFPHPAMVIAIILAAVTCATLAGCDVKAPQNTWDVDQCMRRDVFKSCMASLPAGPVATKYNDWDEVVEACDDAARKQSSVQIVNIPEGCR